MMPSLWHMPFWSLKTGNGCLANVEFDTSNLASTSEMLVKNTTKLSGLLLKARRSKSRSTSKILSWKLTAKDLEIWKETQLGRSVEL
jgi:hypothetical protein